MRVAFLAVSGLTVLALVGSESAVAQVNSFSTQPITIAKAPLEQTPKKQVTSPAKANTKVSPNLERANGPDRDNPLLGLLWLLTGSTRRQ